MDYKKVVEIIKDLSCRGYPTYREAKKLAIEACEKQIPKKVKKPNRFPCDIKCPNGCMMYETYAVGYCPNCGQKIEWY